MENTTTTQEFDHSKECIFDALGENKEKFMAKVDDWNNKQIQNGGFDSISANIEAKMKHFSKKELAILLTHPKFVEKKINLNPKVIALLAELLK